MGVLFVLLILKLVESVHAISCAAGQYGASGATVCSTCSAGSYSAAGAVTCTTCSVGTYSVQGSSTCSFTSINCPAGFFASGINACLPCASGTFSTLGSSTCSYTVSSCPAGTIPTTVTLNSLVVGACKACAAGTFQNATICSTCAANTYSTAGSTICPYTYYSCPAGFYANSPGYCYPCINYGATYYSNVGWSSCSTTCPSGQYVTGAFTCGYCPAGTYTASSNTATACTPCVAGQYQSLTGQSSCIICPSGTYSSAGSYYCSPCAAGTYAGSNTYSCSLCPSPQYSTPNSGSCVYTATTCPAGSYSNGNGGCALCPEGTYSVSTGQTSNSSCKTCALGSFSTAGAASCIYSVNTCPAGTYSNSNIVGGCSACPLGTFSTQHSSSCMYTAASCPAGTASSGLGACVMCPANQFSTAGSSTCPYTQYTCPSGTLVDFVSGCVKCPSGLYSLAGSQSNTCTSGCSAGYYVNGISTCGPCNPGYFSTGNAYSCTLCPSPSYSISGQSTCDFTKTTCPAGTAPTGSSSCSPCGTGTFSSANSLVCTSCFVGTYNNLVGQATCTPCPAGWYAQGTGYTGCNQCSNGYSSSSNSNVCTICPANTFQRWLYNPAVYGSYTSSCILCPTGSLSNPGATSCSCIAGQYSSSGYTTTGCSTCSGKAFSVAAATSCAYTSTTCPGGTFANVTSNACVQCSANYYSSTGSSSCQPCPINSYSSSGSNTCFCNAGFYSLSGNATSSTCISCASNTYSPANSTSCSYTASTCPPGTFASPPSSCQSCGATGFATAGSTTCSSCPSGWTINPTNGNCYWYSTTSLLLNWAQSESYCENQLGYPAHLASVHTQAENTWLATTFTRGAWAWIGYTSLYNQYKTYIWTDGTSNTDFSAWDINQPDNSGGVEHCAHMWGDYLWNDWNCANSISFLCEYSPLCVPGTYLGSSGSCVSCPLGTYQSSINTAAACLPCPAGSYCGSLSLKAPTGLCNKGSYCPIGSSSASGVLCPPGSYGANYGLTNSNCDGLCSAGYYCPAGSTSPTPSTCNAGYWGSIGQTVSTCSGPCNAGYLCPPGSITDTAAPCGTVSNYCPQGSAAPLVASPGYYTVSNGLTNDLFHQTQQLPCKDGSYCTGGVSYLCPAGTYGIQIAGQAPLSTPACSGQCTAGYICAIGSTSPKQAPCASPLDQFPQLYYCPSGATTRLVASLGYYTLPIDASSTYMRQSQIPCDPGFTCTNGVEITNLNWANCPSAGVIYNTNEFTQAYLGSLIATSPRNTTLYPMVYGFLEPTAINYLSINSSGSIFALSIDYQSLISPVLTFHATVTQTSNSISCAVTVNVIHVPQAPYWVTVSPAYFQVTEKSRVGTVIGTLHANDRDSSDSIEFFVTDAVLNPYFGVNPCKGEIIVLNSGFPKAPLGQLTTINVGIKDMNGLVGTGTITVNIQVMNIIDPPVINRDGIYSLAGFNCDEDTVGAICYFNGQGTNSSLAPLASDDNPGSNMTWTISQNTFNNHFAISMINGNPTLITFDSLDYESISTYYIVLQVTNNYGLHDQQGYTISLNDINDVPLISDVILNMYENTLAVYNLPHLTAFDQDAKDVGKLVFSISNLRSYDHNGVLISYAPGPAAQEFLISSSTPSPAQYPKLTLGLLSFTGPSTPVTFTGPSPDYELTSMYTFTVTVVDTSNANSSATITVNLIDINEQPIITPTQTFSIHENVAIGTQICSGLFDAGSNIWRWNSSIPCTGGNLLAADPDVFDNQRIFYTLLSSTVPAYNNIDASSLFSIDAITGNVYTKSLLDYEDPQWVFTNNVNFILNVQVQDNGSPSLSSTTTFQVSLFDINEPPILPTPNQVLSVDEKSPIGTVVGVVQYFDPDKGDTHSFQISSSSTIFQVDSQSGVISVYNNKDLDFTLGAVRTIKVTVTDAGGLTASGNIQINVNYVVEPPTFSSLPSFGYSFKVCLGVKTSQIIGSVVAIDRLASDPVSFTLLNSTFSSQFIGSSGNGVSIDNSGTIKALASFPSSKGNFNVTVAATNLEGLFSTTDVLITIVDITCAPSLVLGQSFSIQENSAYPSILNPNGLSFESFTGNLNDITTSFVTCTPSIGLIMFSIDSVSLKISLTSVGANYLNYEQLISSYNTANFTFGVSLLYNDGIITSTGSGVVVISVLDVPEVPLLNSLVFNVNENVAIHSFVANVSAIPVDFDSILSYSFPNQNIPFNIDMKTGTITTAALLNWLINPIYTFPITASSYVNRFNSTMTATTSFTINVNHINQAPLFNPTKMNYNISGNAALLSVVGPIIKISNSALSMVSDRDPGDYSALVFSIVSGNDDGVFSIDSNLGSISLAGTVDYWNVQSYSLVIAATDPGGLSATATITLNVQYFDNLIISSLSNNGSFSLFNPLGGEILTINGLNVGFKNHTSIVSSVSVQIVMVDGSLTFASNCAVPNGYGNNFINCLTPAGVGANLNVVVHVTTLGISAMRVLSSSFSYSGPLINSVLGMGNLNTYGGDSIIINGINFGTNLTFSSSQPVVYNFVTYSSSSGNTYLARNCSVSIANTQLTCLSAIGVGTNLVVKVSIGSVSVIFNSGNVVFSYANPSILSVGSILSIPTTGLLSSPLVINGSQFGPSSTVPVVYFNSGSLQFSGLACIVSIPHTQISCISVSAGVGAGFAFQVEIDTLYSNSYSTALSFDKPEIFNVTGPGSFNAVTVGGQVVNIVGLNFGPKGLIIPLVNYGPLSTSASRYVALSCEVYSQTTISCLTAQGTGFGHSWKVSIGGQMSAINAANTYYTHPSVTFFSGDGAFNANTEGGQLVNIFGYNFGPIGGQPVTALYGPDLSNQFPAADCAVVVAHTSIQCNTTEGAGSLLSWSLYVDGLKSQDATTNYNQPVINSVTLVDGGSALTSGNQTVVIDGLDFGPLNHPYLSVSYGMSGSGYTPNCTHDLIMPHRKLFCKTVPGFGLGLSWIVTVLGQASANSAASFNYLLPTITYFTATGPSVGGIEITFTGNSFAIEDKFSKLSLSLGSKTVSIDKSTVSMNAAGLYLFSTTLPGGNGLLPISATVQSLFGYSVKSNLVVFNYFAPRIDSILTEVVNNQIQLTIAGANFGNAYSNVNPPQQQIVRPFYSINNGELVSLTFDAFQQYGDGKIIAFLALSVLPSENDIGELYLELTASSPCNKVDSSWCYSNSFSFSSSSPIITFPSSIVSSGSNTILQLFNTAGGDILTIPVQKAGIADTTTRNVTINGLPCSFLIWSATNALGDGNLLCTIPPGEGTNLQLIVFRGQSSSAVYYINYAPPSFIALSTPSLAPTAGLSITIAGQNFGLNDTKIVSMLSATGSRTILNYLYVSHYSIIVYIPQGQGTGIGIYLDVGLQETVTPFAFSYYPPTINSISPAIFDSSGSNVVISGNNFGVSPQVLIQGDTSKPCVIQGAVTSSSLVCKMPPGQGKNLNLIVVVGGQSTVSNSNNLFAYTAPQITSIIPNHGPTSGGVVVVVSGSNLGAGVDSSSNLILLVSTTIGGPSILINPTSLNSTNLIFTLPVGQGDFDLSLSVGYQVNLNLLHSNTAPFSLSTAFSYDAPMLLSLTPNHGITAGGYKLVLQGQSFGVPDSSGAFTASVTIGNKPAQVLLQNHTTIIVYAPAGIGANLDVLIKIGSKTNLNAKVFSYNPPTINCIGCGFFPNTANAAGATITICAENIATNSADSSDTFVGFPIDDADMVNPMDQCSLTWASNDFQNCGGSPYLSCITPNMLVGPKNISISVGNQTSFFPVMDSKSIFFQTRCAKGSYGLLGEYCLDCSQDVFGYNSANSAYCNDTTSPKSLWGGEPIAEAGFWEYKVTDNNVCITQNRTVSPLRPDCSYDSNSNYNCVPSCPGIVPCFPSESCIMGNKCSLGYTYLQDQCIANRLAQGLATTCNKDSDCLVDNNGKNLNLVCDYDDAASCTQCLNNVCSCVTFDPYHRSISNQDEFQGDRCSLCTAKKYYRETDQCVKCPELQTWEIVVGTLFVTLAIYSVYKFSQSGVSLALATIAMDYFQVLSMFSKTKVKWPAEMLTLFKLLSVFNFNINIYPPECFLKKVDFSVEWIGIQLFPFIAMIFFGFYLFARVFYAVVNRRSLNDGYVWNDYSKFVNYAFTVFYFMYMYLLRQQLDIVACSGIKPDDGFTYTSFTSIQCGGLCRCWQKGSLQMALLPFAALAFLVYSIGFIVLLYRILFRNKQLILHDQIIRAYMTIKPEFKYNTRFDVVDIGKRYSRLYFRFHPDYYWWSLVVLGRKLLICLAALFYTKNPSLQFSLVLLIMFGSYVLQIKHKPYMSEKNHALLIKTHIERYQAYRKKLTLPEDSIEYEDLEVHKYGKLHSMVEDDIRTDLSFDKRQKVQRLEDIEKIKKKEAAEIAITWIMSYNTVESTLLACAVLVCLSGIMFQAVPPNSGYDNERHTLTYFCIILIGFSMLYIAFVMWKEIQTKMQFCGKTYDFKKGEKDKRTQADNDKDSLGDFGIYGAGGVPLSPNSAKAKKMVMDFESEGISLDRKGTSVKRSPTVTSEDGHTNTENPLMKHMSIDKGYDARPLSLSRKTKADLELKTMSPKTVKEKRELEKEREKEMERMKVNKDFDIDMNINPIYSIAGLGEGMASIDDVMKRDAERKRLEEEKLKEEQRKANEILEDNARIKRQMQEAERLRGESINVANKKKKNVM